MLSGRRSLQARCNTQSVYIINIRMEGLAFSGTPADLMHCSLKQYFEEEENDYPHLHLLDIAFNIRAVTEATAFREKLDSAVVNLCG